jgi:hypothetical protein
VRHFAILFTTTAGLTFGDANAQAHGPPATEFKDESTDINDPVLRAAKLAELEAWLRRLVGRFRDTRNPKDFERERMDCTGIGTGPGVQCFTTMVSNSFSVRYGVPKSVSSGNDSPEAKLFGLDPGALRVNYMQVDSKGLPEGGLGTLSGDTLYLKYECKIPPDAKDIVSCENRLRLYAPPNSKALAVSWELTLRISTRRGIVETSSEETSWLERLSDGDP